MVGDGTSLVDGVNATTLSLAGAGSAITLVDAGGTALASVGAADLIAEAAFEPEALAALLRARLSDAHGLSVRAAAARASAKPEAAKALADIAEAIAR